MDLGNLAEGAVEEFTSDPAAEEPARRFTREPAEAPAEQA